MEPEPDILLHLTTLFFHLFAFPSLDVILGGLSILLLLVSSALISSSEVAFFSLTDNDLEKLDQENSGPSRRILALKEKPRILLATILISNNFINIAIVIISDFLTKKIIPPSAFKKWATFFIESFPINESYLDFAANTISFLITVAGVTFLLVLFGEVAPKIYASINNIQLSKMMSGPLFILRRLFLPVSSLLVNTTNFLEKKLASAQGSSTTSRRDIDDAIDLTVSHEEDALQEIDILKSIVKFGDVSVKQIMRSRVDVLSVDFRMGYQELLKVVKASGYSRIPVYDEDFDHVTGILYVKELLGYIDEKENFEWQELIRPEILYVPETKKIDDLLKEFQKERMHMAIVVDEYGGTSGIVTLEDIMEEIIGEIQDEFDQGTEVVYKKIDNHTYLFEGKTLLNDVCRIIGIDTSTFDEVKGESDSVAGLILEILGEMPKPELEIPYNQFCFKIVSVSKRRIEQVLITVTDEG